MNYFLKKHFSPQKKVIFDRRFVSFDKKKDILDVKQRPSVSIPGGVNPFTHSVHFLSAAAGRIHTNYSSPQMARIWKLFKQLFVHGVA
jgi:hypothetical protein